ARVAESSSLRGSQRIDEECKPTASAAENKTACASARHARLPAASAPVVRPPPARVAVARNPRSLRGPRLGVHASADAGDARDGALPALPPSLSDPGGPRGGTA